jgi:hypothetical protein
MVYKSTSFFHLKNGCAPIYSSLVTPLWIIFGPLHRWFSNQSPAVGQRLLPTFMNLYENRRDVPWQQIEFADNFLSSLISTRLGSVPRLSHRKTLVRSRAKEIEDSQTTVHMIDQNKRKEISCRGSFQTLQLCR